MKIFVPFSVDSTPNKILTRSNRLFWVSKMASILHVTTLQEFTEAIQSAPCAIKFTAPWCGPCKTLAPYFEELATTYSEKAKFIEINTDTAPEITRHFQIKGIPRVYFYLKEQRQDDLTVTGGDPNGLIHNMEQFVERISSTSAQPSQSSSSVQPIPMVFPSFGVATGSTPGFLVPMANCAFTMDEFDTSTDDYSTESDLEEEDDIPIEK